MKLDNKVALITGGNSGIGLAPASRFTRYIAAEMHQANVR